MTNRSALGSTLLAGLFLAGGGSRIGHSQDQAVPKDAVAPEARAADVAPSLAIQIPDEPRGVDPATLLPKEVTRPATVRFQETPFKEVVKWLREEMKLNVLIDVSAIDENHLLNTEPVTDTLVNEPVYALLDRLETIRLAWRFEEGVLIFESLDATGERRSTVSYNLGPLLDAGFRSQPLLDMLQQETTGPWDADEPGTGTLVQLGDVLFVRQTRKTQLEVATLLSALKVHGRRTILLDSPRQTALTEKLRQKVSGQFQNVPLEKVVQQLAAQVQEEIHFDKTLEDAGVNVHEELITLSISDQPLGLVLSKLPLSMDIVPQIRLGGLWLTTKDAENERRLTAVFDVRDLCRNTDEADALMDAIQNQTSGPWDADEPGTGTLSAPKPGVLVVRQTRRQLDSVLELLENYRAALKSSKLRPKDETEEKTQETRYYRVPTPVAEDLLTLLPQLVAPESWQAAGPNEGQGTIRKAASFSTSEAVGAKAVPLGNGKSETTAPTGVVVTPYSVLIIRQTRKHHREISEVLQKIQFGDAPLGDPHSRGMGGGYGGMGGGGGGFGGGFFRIPVAGEATGMPRPQHQDAATGPSISP